MFITTDQRISLTPTPVQNVVSGPEVVMLGHCPGKPNWRHLLSMEQSLARMKDLGFSRQLSALRLLADPERAGLQLNAEDAALKALYLLPIPINSLEQFNVLFPEARSVAAQRRSYLSGSDAWLPFAVQDFFSRGERDVGKTLWVIRTAEEDGVEAFLPRRDADWLGNDPWTSLGAFEIACLPPRAAFMMFPDLERLQLPARLKDLPELDQPRLQPAFLPCDADRPPLTEPDPETPDVPEPPTAFARILNEFSARIALLRPDMHLLLTIPFANEGVRDRGYPAASQEALNATDHLAGQSAESGLRQLQLLYPYLRSADRLLSSPVGVLAARMVESTVRHGPWRSIAGRALSRLQVAYPPLTPQQTTKMREVHSIGLLIWKNGALVLDDERLARPAFGYRSGQGSGEVARFIGWLRRELRAYGERLIFITDPDDPRPSMLLDALFRRLYSQGALAGRVVEESFSVTQRSSGVGTLIFDIELQPALPIDRIRITLAEDQLDLGIALEGRA